MSEKVMESEDIGVLEWLISGSASAKLLDFFINYRDFDYSETDIAESSGVSKRTVFREIPKFEAVGLIKFTRNVGRAKMFRLDPESVAAKHLEKFVFEIATKRIENTINDAKIQERMDVDEIPNETKKENSITNSM